MTTDAEEPGPSAFYNFKCPVCGGSFFRTDLTLRQGSCKGKFFWGSLGPRSKGYAYTGCSFKWDRKDDSEVFTEPKEKR